MEGVPLAVEQQDIQQNIAEAELRAQIVPWNSYSDRIGDQQWNDGVSRSAGSTLAPP